MTKTIKRKPNVISAIGNRFRRRDTSQNVVFVIYFVIFLAFTLLSLYPIYWCFINSMKSIIEFEGDSLALPKVFDMSHYKMVFTEFEVAGQNFWKMLLNSAWQTFGACLLNVTASVLVAYPISRYNFPGKKLVYAIIIFRITIPIVGSAAAQYKLFRTLNMLNNPKTFWVAWLGGFDMTALILYGYFSSISKTYSEAAFLDEANRLQVLWYAILPQALPCIVALFINQVIGKWNDYTTPQLYLREYPNLALGLYSFESASDFIKDGKTVYFAAVILTAIPPVILYSAGQKLMLENMSVGGLKG